MTRLRECLGSQYRWMILQRDDFTCQFCGSRPGNEHLQVDHLLPVSKGGSDHENNLIAACARCNKGKSALIAIPRRMLTGDVDSKGWHTWKRWGDWHLMLTEYGETMVLTFQPDRRDYWIPLDRIHEDGWHRHLQSKPWMLEDDEQARLEAWHDARAAQRGRAWMTLPEFLSEPDAPDVPSRAVGQRWQDFCDAISFARTLVRGAR